MATYTDITNTLNFAVAFKPVTAFPLDARTMFGSVAAAEAAAQTAEPAGSSNTIYYHGMDLTVIEGDTVSKYVIQTDGTLKPAGAIPVGDDKTIVVNDEVIGLKSFGVGYYAYVAATDENPNPYYTYTEGWKTGLEPKVIGDDSGGYSIAWYEPSATTVEGLSSSIANIQSNVEVLAGRVGDTEEAIDTLNGDALTEGSVAKQVSDAVAKIVSDAPEAYDTLVEISTWITTHSESAAAMNRDIVANKTAIDGLKALVGELPEGVSATTVMGYIAEAVAAEETRAKAAEDALSGRITELEGKATVGSVTDSANNGSIIVDGSEIVVYTPVVDDDTIEVNTAGAMAVKAVPAEKVTNLTTMLSDTQTAAEETAAAYTDNVAVAKTSVLSSIDDTTTVNDTDVVSAKLFLDAMTWKTEM